MVGMMSMRPTIRQLFMISSHFTASALYYDTRCHDLDISISLYYPDLVLTNCTNETDNTGTDAWTDSLIVNANAVAGGVGTTSCPSGYHRRYDPASLIYNASNGDTTDETTTSNSMSGIPFVFKQYFRSLTINQHFGSSVGTSKPAIASGDGVHLVNVPTSVVSGAYNTYISQVEVFGNETATTTATDVASVLTKAGEVFTNSRASSVATAEFDHLHYGASSEIFTSFSSSTTSTMMMDAAKFPRFHALTDIELNSFKTMDAVSNAGFKKLNTMAEKGIASGTSDLIGGSNRVSYDGSITTSRGVVSRISYFFGSSPISVAYRERFLDPPGAHCLKIYTTVSGKLTYKFKVTMDEDANNGKTATETVTNPTANAALIDACYSPTLDPFRTLAQDSQTGPSWAIKRIKPRHPDGNQEWQGYILTNNFDGTTPTQPGYCSDCESIRGYTSNFFLASDTSPAPAEGTQLAAVTDGTSCWVELRLSPNWVGMQSIGGPAQYAGRGTHMLWSSVANATANWSPLTFSGITNGADRVIDGFASGRYSAGDRQTMALASGASDNQYIRLKLDMSQYKVGFRLDGIEIFGTDWHTSSNDYKLNAMMQPFGVYPSNSKLTAGAGAYSGDNEGFIIALSSSPDAFDCLTQTRASTVSKGDFLTDNTTNVGCYICERVTDFGSSDAYGAIADNRWIINCSYEHLFAATANLTGTPDGIADATYLTPGGIIDYTSGNGTIYGNSLIASSAYASGGSVGNYGKYLLPNEPTAPATDFYLWMLLPGTNRRMYVDEIKISGLKEAYYTSPLLGEFRHCAAQNGYCACDSSYEGSVSNSAGGGGGGLVRYGNPEYGYAEVYVPATIAGGPGGIDCTATAISAVLHPDMVYGTPFGTSITTIGQSITCECAIFETPCLECHQVTNCTAYATDETPCSLELNEFSSYTPTKLATTHGSFNNSLTAADFGADIDSFWDILDEPSSQVSRVTNRIWTRVVDANVNANSSVSGGAGQPISLSASYLHKYYKSCSQCQAGYYVSPLTNLCVECENAPNCLAHDPNAACHAVYDQNTTETTTVTGEGNVNDEVLALAYFNPDPFSDNPDPNFVTLDTTNLEKVNRFDGSSGSKNTEGAGADPNSNPNLDPYGGTYIKYYKYCSRCESSYTNMNGTCERSFPLGTTCRAECKSNSSIYSIATCEQAPSWSQDDGYWATGSCYMGYVNGQSQYETKTYFYRYSYPNHYHTNSRPSFSFTYAYCKPVCYERDIYDAAVENLYTNYWYQQKFGNERNIQPWLVGKSCGYQRFTQMDLENKLSTLEPTYHPGAQYSYGCSTSTRYYYSNNHARSWNGRMGILGGFPTAGAPNHYYGSDLAVHAERDYCYVYMAPNYSNVTGPIFWGYSAVRCSAPGTNGNTDSVPKWTSYSVYLNYQCSSICYTFNNYPYTDNYGYASQRLLTEGNTINPFHILKEERRNQDNGDLYGYSPAHDEWKKHPHDIIENFDPNNGWNSNGNADGWNPDPSTMTSEENAHTEAMRNLQKLKESANAKGDEEINISEIFKRVLGMKEGAKTSKPSVSSEITNDKCTEEGSGDFMAARKKRKDTVAKKQNIESLKYSGLEESVSSDDLKDIYRRVLGMDLEMEKAKREEEEIEKKQKQDRRKRELDAESHEYDETHNDDTHNDDVYEYVAQPDLPPDDDEEIFDEMKPIDISAIYRDLLGMEVNS